MSPGCRPGLRRTHSRRDAQWPHPGSSHAWGRSLRSASAQGGSSSRPEYATTPTPAAAASIAPAATFLDIPKIRDSRPIFAITYQRSILADPDPGNPLWLGNGTNPDAATWVEPRPPDFYVTATRTGGSFATVTL